MKKIFLFIALIVSLAGMGQNIFSFPNTFYDSTKFKSQVKIGTGNIAPSAALDITSTTKGILFPRMTTTQMNAISSPANGLVIINIDSSYSPFLYNGSWVKIGSGSSGGSGTASTIFNTPNGHVTSNTVVKALGTLDIKAMGDTTDTDNQAYSGWNASDNSYRHGSLSEGKGVETKSKDSTLTVTDTKVIPTGTLYGSDYILTDPLSHAHVAHVARQINDSLNANAKTIRAAQRTGYDSLATNFGDSSLVIKAIDVQLNGSAVTETITDTSIRYNVVVTKSDVGLGNVDNTSDATKNSATATLTNKRWTPRVGSTTSSATPTINTDNVDIYKLTAQAADITSFTTNLSGTPVDGDILEIQITGTATRAITWGSSFVSSTVTLPTTTNSTATLTVVLQYFTTSSYGNNKWVCVNYF